MEKEFNVTLQCLFCKSDQLDLPEDFQPVGGDEIKCGNCGKLNDYESMCNAAIESSQELKDEVEKVIKEASKDFNI